MNTYTKGVHRLYESISTRCTELYGDRNRLRNNIENWKASQIILWSCTWGIVSDVNIEIHWRDIAFVSLWLLELPDILSLRTCSGSMPSPRRRRPTSSFEMEDDNKSTASTTLSPGNKNKCSELGWGACSGLKDNLGTSSHAKRAKIFLAPQVIFLKPHIFSYFKGGGKELTKVDQVIRYIKIRCIKRGAMGSCAILTPKKKHGSARPLKTRAWQSWWRDIRHLEGNALRIEIILNIKLYWVSEKKGGS